MGWAFIWLMVALKIPIIALGWIVWKAIKAEPPVAEDTPADSGGGGGRHPRPRRPQPRHRGPHGEPLPRPPARLRAVASRDRSVR